MGQNNKNETAYFGGGCFWCSEAVFEQLKGVGEVTSGYAGGTMENPSYEDVSSGKSGHAETVKVSFDSSIISYDDLLNVFFYTHDPTTLNQQGQDIGHQYRSTIFYTSEEQKIGAQKFIAQLEKDKVFEKPIVTEIKPFTEFYPAEKYHQDFYSHNKSAPYCQLVIAPKIQKLYAKFKSLLK